MSEEIKIGNLGFTASNDPYRATKDGHEYEELMPAPAWHTETPERDGNVKITVATMCQVVEQYAWQTEKLAARLKGETLYQSCKNIWQFLYDHFKYKEDDKGKEQLRTPAVSWAVRRSRGIDCDDFSIFAACLLKNMYGKFLLPFCFRIVKYPDPLGLDPNPPFSHVYVMVPNKGKRYIVIDGVLDEFDAEKTPIKEYQDFVVMDKASLNGIEISVLSGTDDATENTITDMILGAWFPGRGEMNGTEENALDAVYKHLVSTRDLIASNPNLIKHNEDPQSFLKMLDYAIQYWNTDKRDEALAILADKEGEINELEGLGDLPEDYEEQTLYYGIEGLDSVSVLGKTKKVRAFFNKLKEAAKKVGSEIKEGAQKVGEKVSDVAKSAFKDVIKYSPLTAGARQGLLLALKLNIGKMSTGLKWGYLPMHEAQGHRFDVGEMQKVQDRLKKAQDMFVNVMQGDPKHFKDAILTGRAGGLAGFEDEEENLGIEPITTGATLLATALPFIKKILDLLKDVDMKKLTAKVNPAFIDHLQKAAEAANPIPADVKEALPDNNVTPATQIAPQPETQRSEQKPEQKTEDKPAPPLKTDGVETPAPVIKTPDPTPVKDDFFTTAGNWIKENPGTSIAIVGTAVIAITAFKYSKGLGIVTGKRKRKGKKKNAPPKALAGVKQPKAKATKKPKTKKGKGGGQGTVHL